MLVECGFVRASTSDGREWTFRPSLARIASFGDPQEIVALYVALHGPNAEAEAAYVLACLCDQDDATPLIGWRDEEGWHEGEMAPAERVIIALHLMRHGIVGKAKPGSGSGDYSDAFHAAEYIAAARVHLGLSSADAEALSMTEFQTMLAMKFPEQPGAKAAEIPTAEEYAEAMAAAEVRRAAHLAKMEAAHG